MIIDRRLNDRNKSASNRQRFIRRYKAQLRRAVADTVADRSITDMEQGAEVSIPIKDISEPQFEFGQGGDRDFVLPGNRQFNRGDRLPKPEGSYGGRGNGGGQSGEGGGGEDQFTFSLSKEEFMNLFFDDLELPRLAKTALSESEHYRYRKGGYTPTGTPMNLSVTRSLRNAMARRIALGMPIRKELRELQTSGGPEEKIAALENRLARLPFLDEYDLQFRSRYKVAQPVNKAVMFCLMDVSASMTESKKDLAKRFYILLYLFLSRKYRKVDLVFIRHTDDAEEVSEQEFFHGPKTGGTVVLSALSLMEGIIQSRYSSQDWNIYGAQVSDGDAFGADVEKSRACLVRNLLPLCQYFSYIEVPDRTDRPTPLATSYRTIRDERFAMSEIINRNDVYPALRGLFQKEAA
jgi:uncharacterized protein